MRLGLGLGQCVEFYSCEEFRHEIARSRAEATGFEHNPETVILAREGGAERSRRPPHMIQNNTGRRPPVRAWAMSREQNLALHGLLLHAVDSAKAPVFLIQAQHDYVQR
jgi:hypothetical protein